MVELVNKHIKYYYLFKYELKDFDDTAMYLSSPFLITTINLMADYMAVPQMNY